MDKDKVVMYFILVCGFVGVVVSAYDDGKKVGFKSGQKAACQKVSHSPSMPPVSPNKTNRT